jgi:hypothetical protein
VSAARALAETLSRAFEVPRAVPRDAAGKVESTVLTSARLRDFKGHAGHLHISKTKFDPGLVLLDNLFDPNWKASVATAP